MGEINARFVVIAVVMIKVVVTCVFKWKDIYRMGEGSRMKRS